MDNILEEIYIKYNNATNEAKTKLKDEAFYYIFQKEDKSSLDNGEDAWNKYSDLKLFVRKNRVRIKNLSDYIENNKGDVELHLAELDAYYDYIIHNMHYPITDEKLQTAWLCAAGENIWECPVSTSHLKGYYTRKLAYPLKVKPVEFDKETFKPKVRFKKKF